MNKIKYTNESYPIVNRMIMYLNFVPNTIHFFVSAEKYIRRAAIKTRPKVVIQRERDRENKWIH